MSIFRVEKNNNYTVMANYHLRDNELSFKAKGLLSYMLILTQKYKENTQLIKKMLKSA